MTTIRWTHSATTVHNIGYHIIWCPKYRRRLLTGPIEERLRQLVHDKAIEIGCAIKQLEIMPDHVHLFVKTPPTLAPHFIVRQIKGFTSRILRSEFPSLKSKVPTLWTRSYYCESVGHISEHTIARYIEEQKNK